VKKKTKDERAELLKEPEQNPGLIIQTGLHILTRTQNCKRNLNRIINRTTESRTVNINHETELKETETEVNQKRSTKTELRRSPGSPGSASSPGSPGSAQQPQNQHLRETDQQQIIS